MPLIPELYFSYGQFLVYDEGVKRPGLLWTKRHVGQGFARQDSTVCFATLLEYGRAIVSVTAGGYVSGDYQRVIAVPFQVVSGAILVEGSEESDIDRKVAISPGHYRLVAAQPIVNDDDEDGQERIALFFESVDVPAEKSHVLVADKNLSPSEALLESAETA